VQAYVPPSEAYPPAGVHPPPAWVYPPPIEAYPPSSSAYPPPGTAYPPPGTAYPPPGTAYPPPSTAYPPPSTAYPPPSTAYPPPSTGYPPPAAGGFPPGIAYQPYQLSPDQAYAMPAYQHGYADPYGYSPYPAARPTDGMAVAALVLSCIGALAICAYGFGGLLGIVGAILGHVARRRIRNTGASGEGMALTGIIVGWTAAAMGVLIGIGVIVLLVVTDSFGTAGT